MTFDEIAVKPPVDPKNPNFYLDKSQLNQALKDHKKVCLLAESQGVPPPGISDYIGACFLRIARGLAMKNNFRNYSFINDMISDAVMTCLKYVRTYDPDRVNPDTNEATSALSYFTQTCHYSFLNRIKTEHKQTRVKKALIYSADIDTFTLSDDDAGDFHANLNEFILSLGPDDVNDISKNSDTKKDAKPGPLDVFM